MLQVLSAFFDNTPIGITVLERGGIIVYVNRWQCEQSNVAPQELLGKHHRSLARDALERAGILPAYDRLIDDGIPFEVTLPRYAHHVEGMLVSLAMRGFRHEELTVLMTTVDEVSSNAVDRYEQLFENASDGIFIVSPEGRYEAVNGAFCEMLGVSREDVVGKTTELFLPGRFAQSLERIERTLREGRFGPYELEITCPAGRKCLSLNLFALHENGRPVAVMNIARDVTEVRRRQEEREGLHRALGESEEKFRRMIHGNPDPVALSDFRTGRFLEVNDAWCRFSGFRREEILGPEVDVMTFVPDQDQRKQFAVAVKRDGFARDFGVTLSLRGEDRVGSISGTLLELDGRRVVVTWLRDVTERRRMEAALRESEERFRRLAEAAPVGILRTDSSGRCTYTNARLQEMAGLTLEGSLGEGWQAALHPEDLGWVTSTWRSTVAEGSRFDGEFRFRLSTGVVCWAQVHVRPIHSEDGGVVGFVGTAEDISDRRFVDQMRRDMVRMLSHDIKNPLAVIAGFTELVRDDLEAGRYVEMGPFLDAVEGAAEQAKGLTLNFLEAERIEAGQLRLDRESASLNEIAEKVLAQQAVLARMRKVTLTPDLEPRLGPARIDRGLIERVIANLVSNALKFSPEGGVVVVSTREREDTLILSVSDDGPGVADDALPHLFQRFSRADRRGADSTGLGLFIVRTIVEAHGGRVTVERRLEGGSCFVVMLPRSPRDDAPKTRG